MIPIILEKQKNIRDLGDTVTLDGRSIKRNKLIRSGRLSELSAADATYLLGTCRIRTVVDLRSAKESEERPDPQTRCGSGLPPDQRSGRDDAGRYHPSGSW